MAFEHFKNVIVLIGIFLRGYYTFFVRFFFLEIFPAIQSFTDSSETQHRTKAASEKQHDLWCHKCDSMIDGEKCLDLSGNYSYLHQKCSKEQKKCQVCYYIK